MLPLWAREDLGAMSRKGYSTFPKAPASDCLVSYLGQSLGASYLSAEMQLIYSTAPADRVIVIGTIFCRYVTV